MKLEGSLDAFSLPDIFQLLSFTKKSGGLHLSRAATHGCVYFRDGAITDATSDDNRQGLARRLIGSTAIGDDALSAAVDRAASEAIGVGRALRDAGAIDSDVLSAMVAEQAVDAVFDFLRWADGDFSFSLDESSPDDVGVALNVDEIVAEARGRLESWERACAVIPSPDTVLSIRMSVTDDPHLSRSEWALVALVDGRRTVAEIVALAGRGDYAVVSALATLVERELLAAAGAGDSGALMLARRHALLGRLESTPDLASAAVMAGATAATAPAAPSVPAAPAAPGADSASHTEGPDAVAAPDAPPPAQFAPVPPPAPEPALAEMPGDESIFAGVGHPEMSTASTVASVLAAAANGGVRDNANGGGDGDASGARFVADTRAPVIPPRPEPFMPRRRPDFPEEAPRAAAVAMGGGAAVAAEPVRAPDDRPHIERDPSVNKSLLLRLIAGVRGL